MFTGYLRDITERRRAEQELMASRGRLVTTLINLQLAEQKWETAPQRAKELLGLALRDARLGTATRYRVTGRKRLA